MFLTADNALCINLVDFKCYRNKQEHRVLNMNVVFKERITKWYKNLQKEIILRTRIAFKSFSITSPTKI